MTLSAHCYRLTVAGHLSHTATLLMVARFGAATSISCVGADTTVDLVADQPALRSLLTLLWDLGHELVAINPLGVERLGASTVNDLEDALRTVGARPEVADNLDLPGWLTG